MTMKCCERGEYLAHDDKWKQYHDCLSHCLLCMGQWMGKVQFDQPKIKCLIL